MYEYLVGVIRERLPQLVLHVPLRLARVWVCADSVTLRFSLDLYRFAINFYLNSDYVTGTSRQSL